MANPFSRLLRWRPAPAAAELAEPPKAAEPDMREFGATGTPILGGYLRDAGEYNPDLSGLAAFSTYEKMRRSDAQVAATLLGTKLPIRAAEWTIAAPLNPSPIEREATEFVRMELQENIDLGAVIENALLMLDFGCAAHEDCWQLDGSRVRLAKVAPRLPLTFNRWLTGPGNPGDAGYDPNLGPEDLRAIEQVGWSAERYVTVQVPAHKLALFTFQQEGSNFAGRSLLRPMYQHWFLKSGLYKVDAISCERNGMGVPAVTMGKEPTAADRTTAKRWVEQLTAHEKTGLLLPPDWKFELVGVTGTLRDPKESIAHHNSMISMAGLAQFMLLGQTPSGNRALGDTMSDFFYMGLQATAHHIADVINWTTIARLVDFNFLGVKRYPYLVPQHILALKFETLVDALEKLTRSGLITPDDSLEPWLRKQIGLPEAPAGRIQLARGRTMVGGGAAVPDAPAGARNAKLGAVSGSHNPQQATGSGLARAREVTGWR